ncbi:hypothetical protein [Aquimarina aggregata]|uniref:hypothetical protein n=1 Tax=Aquimarina aggregata TaxID=1642818 RepID=UPI0024910A37|nr:hypothetical protein [Aquimarina aggregata]
MNARQQSSDMSLCIKKGIKIYPIVYARNQYKLVVERNGIPKKGNAIYPQESQYDKKTKELLKMSVHEKIHQLYSEMASKIRKHTSSKENSN